MSELTPEMREALDRRGDDRMSAYFFGFDSTTSDAINDVLAAVAFAGKAFHSTEQWGDDDYMPFTMVDLIQATANEAADRIEELTAERDALRGITNDVLWLTRLAVGSSWPGEMAEQVERAAARVRALLVPEDGDR